MSHFYTWPDLPQTPMAPGIRRRLVKSAGQSVVRDELVQLDVTARQRQNLLFAAQEIAPDSASNKERYISVRTAGVVRIGRHHQADHSSATGRGGRVRYQ